MAELSPQAQVVLDAYWASPWDPSLQQEDRYAIAVALRAAADQVAPEVYFAYTGNGDWDKGMEARNDEIRETILAIAAELENTND